MRFSLSTTLVLACALALGAVGCGDDDKPAAGSGGTGGGGTGGGGTGGGGTGGTGGGGPQVCGGVTCPELPTPPGGGGGALPIPIPMPAGCCTEDNACGIEAAGLLKAGVCLEQDAPGTPTTMCEGEALTLMIPGLPIPITLDLAPCCRPDGSCGLGAITGALLAVAGLSELDLGTGCVEREHLAESLDTMMLMSGALDWTSASCVPTDMDAGMGDDAGN